MDAFVLHEARSSGFPQTIRRHGSLGICEAIEAGSERWQPIRRVVPELYRDSKPQHF